MAPGWTEEMREVALEVQQGRCAICGVIPSGKRCAGSLQCDHCHDTGKARELLCAACNKALGFVHDSIEILTEMICYLERHDSRNSPKHT